MKAPLLRQRGFALAGLAIAMALITVFAAFATSEIMRRTTDSTAEATGRYLMTVRNALIAFQVRHEAWLLRVDTSGAPAGIYPPPPALTFAANAAGEVANTDVSLLKAEGLLPDDFPNHMPFGERALITLVRSGTCPGLSCQLQSYVYSCHPISRHKSTRSGSASCTSVPPGRDSADPSLLGQVLMSAEGYGGHDLLDSSRFQGAMVNVPRSVFPISNHQGRAMVVASLDATPYAQFVRQGDTRHVFLRNDLTVDGVIQTNAGLLFGNTVTFGSSCTRENMYASTSNGVLAVCKGGIWQLQPDYSVVSHESNLRHNAIIEPTPTCPAGSTPYRMIALQSVDMRVSQGNGMNVTGTLSGNVSGSGSVNASGNVSVTGSFSGTFNAAASSYVEMGQTAAINGNRVFISPDRPGGYATVIQGCRTL